MNKNNEKCDVKPDEQHLLLDHHYDGIQELNNPLPRWWNVIFYTCVAFSCGYFIYYQFMDGPNLREEFTAGHKKVIAAQAEFKRINSAFNQNQFNTILAADGIKKGAVVFETNCVACHAENGKGDIGPNLTDAYWLRAKGTPETIYNLVFNGSEENGMPAWAELLAKEEIYQAVAYVSSLKNTNYPGGKEAQGNKIEE
jgi:cytochrome c oxidase cbb3-type subunit 3